MILSLCLKHLHRVPEECPRVSSKRLVQLWAIEMIEQDQMKAASRAPAPRGRKR